MSVTLGLHRIKDPANLGGILRAAFIFNVDGVAVTNSRLTEKDVLHPANTPKYRNVRFFENPHTMSAAELVARALGLMVHDVPIAVELVPGAEPLHTFVHPEHAHYIFGPESGTLDPEIREACAATVMIPTPREVISLNLAQAVNIVLYDRFMKELNHA